MWTATIRELDGGTYDVTALYTVLDGVGNPTGVTFTYNSTIRKTDAAGFVASAKSALTAFLTKQTAITTAKSQLEAALNA